MNFEKLLRSILVSVCNGSKIGKISTKDDIFNSTLDNMRMEIKHYKIWVTIDETCEVEGRFLAYVIVGILRPDCPGRVF